MPGTSRSSPRRRCRWTIRPPSSAALRNRFPGLKAPVKEDICYATQNRQDAVKDLIHRCDRLVVVGSQSSSNSNRLREMADKAGIPGYLVDGPEHLHREWFDGAKTVGVTAGASAPEMLVQGVIAQLREWGGEVVEELKGREEHVIFALPRALREVTSGSAAFRRRVRRVKKAALFQSVPQ